MPGSNPIGRDDFSVILSYTLVKRSDWLVKFFSQSEWLKRALHLII